MEVYTHLCKLYGYGLCKGTPPKKKQSYKLQYIHFGYRKLLVFYSSNSNQNPDMNYEITDCFMTGILSSWLMKMNSYLGFA